MKKPQRLTMNQWAKAIHDHEIWKELISFGEYLDNVLNEQDHVPEKTWVSRLAQIQSFIGRRLDAVDASIMPAEPLNNILMRIREAKSDVEAFQSNNSWSHILDANSRLDHALTYLGQIPVLLTSDDIGPLKDAAYEYRNFIDLTLKNGRETIDDLSREFVATKASFTLYQGDVQTETQMIRQLSESELSALRKEISTEKARADAVISDLQAQFSNAQENRHNEFNLMVNASKVSLTAYQDGIRTKRIELDDELTRDTRSILNAMNERKAEIEKLVGIISELGMTSGFQKAAKAAEDTTHFFHRVTISAIAGLIVWLGILSFRHTEKLEWPDLVSRILISLAFGAMAAYSAKQADKYLEIQRRNRKLELELQAVGPYLAPLSDEQQSTFRLSLAKQVFGRKDELLIARGNKSPATILDVLASEEVRDLMSKLGPSLTPELIKEIPSIIAAWKKT
jgi:hypothetical protein